MGFIQNYSSYVNEKIARATFGRVFRLQGSGHPKEIKNAAFLTELRAGVTTFATMSYIIAVNASIISQSGGTCVCNDKTDPTCAKDAEYGQCIIGIQRDLITATAAISCLASFMFGFLTNLPVALAPGMGLNAYFTYQVVGFHGTGPVPYRLALTAVFVEGFVFVFLSLIGMRQWLVKLIPSSLKIAATAGIGLFLALIGLSSTAGIGLVSGATSTPMDLAGCLAKYQNDAGVCTSHKMQNPTVWIGIFCGGFLTALLMMYRVKAAIIVGIALVSIISWPRTTSFTYFPHDAIGDEMYDFFKKICAFHPIKNTLIAQDWDLGGAGGKFAVALFTFLYVDILDCTGTLYSMARFSGVVDSKTGSFPRSTIAYCTDAIAISIGSLFGCSPVTVFIESGSGISEGGRTGLTGMTTGMCFFVSIFFAPIFASIPPYATGCTLVIVGFLMARSVVDINWRYAGDALPAFVTLIVMPFSYSIAYGLIAGLLTYAVLNTLTAIIKFVSFGKIVPVDEDLKEYWTYKPKDGRSPWFIRLARSPRQFWDKEAQHDDVDAFDMSSHGPVVISDNATERSHASGSEVTNGKN